MTAIDLILAATASTFLCVSPSVTDGDTWRCQDGTRVRAWGLDAAEMNAPAGPPAKAAAARLINGQDLTCQPKGRSHNRVVALCILPDGRDVAAEMIRQGAAREWVKFSKGYYRSVR